MAYTFGSLGDLYAHGFDEVIDVRAPAEFAEDHLPSAVNLPVLSNAERAAVGTVYKQESPFKARRMGAALIARNAAGHIETHLAGRDGAYRPLVYCWRGGMRSGAFATILKAIGWRVETLEGGYARYRRAVHDLLYEAPLAPRVVLLDGNTGTAKTALLQRLREHGLAVADLEGLARHRGSLFGALAGGQPSQKAFESGLAEALAGAAPDAPLIVEAESSKIGRLTVPPTLWAAMAEAPRIRLAAPLPERAAYLVRAYADIAADTARLADTIERLRPYQPRERIEAWRALAADGDWPALAEALMRDHYDPRYEKHRAKFSDGRDTVFKLAALDEAALDAAAGELAALARRLAG